MLVFVVPVQSKATAKSWNRVSQLFERCVQSVCQQSSPHFQVIVVCNEKPDTAFRHPKISYVEVDFPVPDINSGRPKEILNEKRTDRGRKQLRGLVAAQEFNPTHTMLLDADDLVSKRLAEFVHRHPKANGWFVNKGYRYAPGSYWIYKKANGFHTMCGSCNIIRNDLNKIPENPEYDRGYGYYKFYLNHARVAKVLAEEGTPLEPLPFLGAVYVVQTGENTYFSSSRLYQGIGRYINYRLVTPSIREEFCL
ncbi:glycosyltransferase family 2 protein [Oscillatoria sp. FACHB-1407]|uniref:glycosyltransferase family A protein n=1 Tax=Oscillatoria sp. FACHB-1407 TaxID=2692847 RepID=UPI001684C787|nr:glycosyltransferase family A protein [Oscillatoria sp. FACHB-1407]MBD2461937.1 glycosyltransferase family 2 protein [Oscillatoria sp. FACHB-1407]